MRNTQKLSEPLKTFEKEEKAKRFAENVKESKNIRVVSGRQ